MEGNLETETGADTGRPSAKRAKVRAEDELSGDQDPDRGDRPRIMTLDPCWGDFARGCG